MNYNNCNQLKQPTFGGFVSFTTVVSDLPQLYVNKF
jgi:hypothetical protein